jgi:hypothetical protein
MIVETFSEKITNGNSASRIVAKRSTLMRDVFVPTGSKRVALCVEGNNPNTFRQ